MAEGVGWQSGLAVRQPFPCPFRCPQLLFTMSSFDKVVKGACKPKAAVPKSKVCLSVQPSLARVLTDCVPRCLSSTWTPSSPPPGPKMAQCTTCVRPLRQKSRNPMRL